MRYLFYAAADVAFVGGSLVPVGGHNLLEPAAVALPILVGPYTANIEGMARILTEKNAFIVVRDHADLSKRLVWLLGDVAARVRFGSNACQAFEENRGALNRLVHRLNPFLVDGYSTGGATQKTGD